MSEQSRTHQDPTARGRTRRSRRTARIVTTSLVAGGIAVAGGTAVAATGGDDARAATAVVAATSTGADLTADRQAEQTRTAGEVAVEGTSPGPVDDVAAADAFYSAGYTYDDAVALAAVWTVDTWQAKVLGGGKLAAGEELPVAPGSSGPAPADPASGESAAVDAFFAAGYTYDDAVELGQLWSLDPYQAKVTGGAQLLAGATLPVAP